MFTQTIKSCALLLVGLTVIVIAGGQDKQKREAPKTEVSFLNEIRDYRRMFRVNEKPIDMVEETRLMCAPPSLMYGPHYNPGVVYYVNEVARLGLKTYSSNSIFPVGSIIVKEKQERRTDDSVQIITVMKKVHAGDSENSWEYKMYDTKKWAEIDISKPGTAAAGRSCIECHRRYRDNDYVSDKGIELLLGGKRQ